MKISYAKLEPESQSHGILCIFCDLNESDKEDFRPWLTEDMFPARINIGFNCCASFDLLEGSGSEFATLYKVPNQRFLYGDPYQNLRRDRLPRDINFHKNFINPRRYILASIQPNISHFNQNFSQYLSIDEISVLPENEERFNIWYYTEYLPELESFSSNINHHRYISIEGASKYVLITGFEKRDTFKNRGWLNLYVKLHKHSSLTVDKYSIYTKKIEIHE